MSAQSALYRLYDERGRFLPNLQPGANGMTQNMMEVYAKRAAYGGEYANNGGAAMLAGLAASGGAGLPSNVPRPGDKTMQQIDAELVRRLHAKRRASQQDEEGMQQMQEASRLQQQQLSEKEVERQERKKRRVENGRPFDDPDDEINSDLDDTEDEDDDNEQDDDNSLILCLYEKVTRTKNKWKCTLKDGVMTVNGKDMLFQKANGEFEW
jgi:hypothetical protein